MTKPQKAASEKAPGQAALWPFSFPQGTTAPGFDAWMAMNESLLTKLGDAQQEAVRFISARLEDDIARQKALLACKSPTELGETYTAFVQKMIADYADEASRLGKIATDIQSTCSQLAAGPSQPDVPDPKA